MQNAHVIDYLTRNHHSAQYFADNYRRKGKTGLADYFSELAYEYCQLALEERLLSPVHIPTVVVYR